VNRLTLRKALGILYDEKLIAKLGPRGTFVMQDSAGGDLLKGRRIGFLLVNRSLSDPFHGMIVGTLQNELQQLGASLLFHGINKRDDLESLLAAQAKYKELDGLVVDGEITPSILKKLKRFRIPLVLVGCLSSPDPLEKTVDRVLVDASDYAYRGVRRLIKQGFRRIAFVDGPAYQWSMAAQQGYMRALEEAEIDYQEELVVHRPGSAVSDGVEAAGQVLSSRPDALFVRSEKIARGLYDELRNRQVDIPGELAMINVGHPGDSIEHLGLPRIVLEPAVMARQALDLLQKRLASPHAEITNVILRPRLLASARRPTAVSRVAGGNTPESVQRQ
jgi:DNA-binding LacI/PurR family transcriptional regulator